MVFAYEDCMDIMLSFNHSSNWYFWCLMLLKNFQCHFCAWIWRFCYLGYCSRGHCRWYNNRWSNETWLLYMWKKRTYMVNASLCYLILIFWYPTCSKNEIQLIKECEKLMDWEKRRKLYSQTCVWLVIFRQDWIIFNHIWYNVSYKNFFDEFLLITL